MLKVFALVIFMYGTGKAVAQIGPFETIEMCKAAQQQLESLSMWDSSACIEISQPPQEESK